MSDSVGSVSVDVVPDARGWAEKLRAQIRDTVFRPKVEPDFDPATEEKFREKGKTSGENFSGEFDRTVQSKIRAAIASLPDVKVGADTSEATRGLESLRTQLETLSSDIGINVSDDAALAEIQFIRTQLAELAANNPDIRINVDALAAEAKLGEIQAMVDRLNGETATVGVNSKGGFGRANSQLGGFLDKLSLLPALAIAAGAALIPLTAALGGLVAALTAPLAIAAGGATLFAFLGGFAIKQTEAQKKTIDQLAKAVDSAKQSLANAQASANTSASNSLATAQASAAASIKAAKQAEAAATTAAGRKAARQRVDAAEAALAARQSSIEASRQASVAAAQRKVNEAVSAYHAALKELSPEQTRFLAAVDNLKGTFSGLLTGATGASLLTPFTDGLNLLSYVLRALDPVIRASSKAFSGMVSELSAAASTPGFQHFVTMLAHQVGPDLEAFAHILGNLTVGIGGLIAAMSHGHSSGGLLKDLDHLTQNFADWANSKDARHDVRQFFEYVHKVGPQVGDTIAGIARAGGHLASALAPLGPPTLRAVEGIADAISGIPVPVLTALAAAFVAITAAAKVGKGLSSISSSLGGLSLGKGGGGVLGGILSNRGATPANPLYVFSVNGGGGVGGPGGGLTKQLPKVFGPGVAGLSAPEAAAMVALFAGGTVAQGVLTHKEISSAQNLALSRSPGIYGQFGGPSTGNHIDYGKLAADANGYFTSTTNHWDALKAHAASASAQIDMIGPHAMATFAAASRDVDTFAGKLAQIRDKRFRIIAETQDAVKQLEAVQAFRLHDKKFSVQLELQIERAVGPGGGMGRPVGGDSGGASGGGARRAGPTYTGPIHVQAHDYRDFTQQMEQRHSRAAYDSVRSMP